MFRPILKAVSIAILPLFVLWFILEELTFIIRYRLTGAEVPRKRLLP